MSGRIAGSVCCVISGAWETDGGTGAGAGVSEDTEDTEEAAAAGGRLMIAAGEWRVSAPMEEKATFQKFLAYLTRWISGTTVTVDPPSSSKPAKPSSSACSPSLFVAVV